MTRISTATVEYNSKITELYHHINSKDENKHFINQFLKYHTNIKGSLIDLCCGLGNLCDEFRVQYPGLSVTGCDRSKDMLKHRTDLIVNDIVELTGQYDNIISTYGYRHFDDVDQFWNTIFRLSHSKTKILVCDWLRPDDLDTSIEQLFLSLSFLDDSILQELHPMTEMCIRSAYSKTEIEEHIKKYPTLAVDYYDTGCGIELFYVYNAQ